MKLLNRICAFALFLALAHSQPAPGQGLMICPDGYSSWEEYMQHQHKEAEGVEQDGRLIELLYNLGFASFAPSLNHAYAESLVKQAWAWESARELNKVEQCYRKAVEVEDDQFSLQSHMGRYAQVLCSLDRHVEQKHWLKKLVALEAEYYGRDSPRRWCTLRDLARCYAELKETDNQIETLQQILKLLEHARVTNDDDYHYDYESISAGELARAMEQNGDLSGAERNYTLAVSALKPGYAGVWSVLGETTELAEFYLRHQQPRKAEPFLKQVYAVWLKDRHFDSRHYAQSALKAYARILADNHRTAEAAAVKSELAHIEVMDRW